MQLQRTCPDSARQPFSGPHNRKTAQVGFSCILAKRPDNHLVAGYAVPCGQSGIVTELLRSKTRIIRDRVVLIVGYSATHRMSLEITLHRIMHVQNFP